MPTIDYYFATLSPFTYIAGTRLEDIAARHGLDIAYKPLDIIALFGRTGGTPPGQRHVSRQDYRAQDLPRQARKAGVPLNLKPAHWPTNAAPSAYAIINAERERKRGADGDMGKLVHAIGRACWAEDKDIAEGDVIRAALTEAGFDPALADADLLYGAETYTANLEEAVAKGAFGAPFYITPDDQRFWGQDRLDDLDLVLSGKL